MKKLILVTVMFFSSLGFAVDYQAAAEAKFDGLSAVEALQAGFKVRAFSIHMPGTSSWFNPMTELCVNGKTIQTITPKSYCVAWKSTEDGKTKIFNRQSDAEAYGGSVSCAEKTVPAIVSSPIVYQDEVCATWQATNKDGDVKTFSSVIAAKNFSKNDSALCVAEKVVTKTMPTSYKAEFYRNSVDSDNYLGSHTYSIRSCSGGTLPPVVAN